MNDLLDDHIEQQASNLALARKWRPRRFAEVIGQEHAVRTLRNALASGRLHHAYMFTGTRGVGKTTLARILAKAFNCKSLDEGEPCCECDSCTQVDIGNHPDLIEMDAASTTQVDNMRELLDSARYAPSTGTYKVYIIDEVHMLSRHAFNAMLKTLEEPPAHIKFILATTDPQQVPATVQSRCLRFSLRRLPTTLVASHLGMVLGKEKISFDEQALAMIAAQSDGSVRDALSVLEEAIASQGEVTFADVREMLGLAGVETVPNLLGHVIQGDAKGALALADEIHEKGAYPETILKGMIEEVHKAQLASHANELREDVAESLLDLDMVKAQLIYEISFQALERLPASPDPKVALDMALLRMLPLFELAGKQGGNSSPKPGPKDEQAAEETGKTQKTEKAKQSSKKESSSKAGLPSSAKEWLACSKSFDPKIESLSSLCSFVSVEGSTLHLAISKEDEHMLNYEKDMQEECRRRFGDHVVVKVATSDQPMENPAVEEERLIEKKTREIIQTAENSEMMDMIRKKYPNSRVAKDFVLRPNSD